VPPDDEQSHSRRADSEIAGPSTQPDQPVRLLAIFFVFLKLGTLSFGGGMTGWVYREVVQQRNWICETEFLSGMAISQIVPGANVANLAIYIGQRLRGTLGAVVALFALLLVPFFVVIGLYFAYTTISGFDLVSIGTDGIAAAAIGLIIMVVWRSGLQSVKNVASGLALAATFFAVGIMHWPLLPVVFCIAPLSIAAAWPRKKPDAG
jgi:chromate transporter